MVLSQRTKSAGVVLCLALLLGGCADYMNNWDRVSTQGGNAHEANTAIQEVTAWPEHVENTTIEHGG